MPRRLHARRLNNHAGGPVIVINILYLQSTNHATRSGWTSGVCGCRSTHCSTYEKQDVAGIHQHHWLVHGVVPAEIRGPSCVVIESPCAQSPRHGDSITLLKVWHGHRVAPCASIGPRRN
eukprot:COSAG01_NODE_799_length_13501_cov_15.980749_7_plen_120_part_00